MRPPSFTVLLLTILACVICAPAQSSFVAVRGNQFFIDKRPYYFVGANYWYGSLLGLEKDKKRGVERLRRELDLLKSNGVTNLRLMAGAEGSGLLNGITRVGPPIQPREGKFDESVLKGLDILLVEMAKREMKAVIFLSNNWEWSGGFQQYLLWNKAIDNTFVEKKPTWDELRDTVAKFYSCSSCIEAYRNQAAAIVGRTNSITKGRYADDSTIMAWEIANEPRPMRPAANEAYKAFLRSTALWLKAADRTHLVTVGHEGWIGTESIKVFEAVHRDANIDYITIHIWPKNWGWFEAGKMAEGFETILDRTREYASANSSIAKKLAKPMVIEEFGLPRDGGALLPETPTTLRDRYYADILSYIGHGNVAGANFWAFAGTGRPQQGHVFWKKGDDRLGDPPMEEQGLNSVFDSDASTWKVISAAAVRARQLSR